MDETLAKAWGLFDSGNYNDAETLYLECYGQISTADHEHYWQVLMGLIYVESYLKKFKEARSYAALLIFSAVDNEEKHIALHQAGMTERLAKDYETAMHYFFEEEAVIKEFFADDPLPLSANLYEQGYISMKLDKLALAEKTMRSALALAEKSKDFICIGCAYRGLGEVMQAAKRKEEANSCFHKAMDAFEKGNDPYGIEEVKQLLLS